MSSRYGEWPEGDPRRCARRPEFVHRTQAEARCNYWEAR